ncbi:hypothetical protein [Microbispora sp. NBRC 16548]|uniref:hypothetical protein n=1 Tax=Microbispora sp. NBRC 16548 TaxID=3030994 RepID=UPI002553044C|nr:hypothetical protein [Microbispora sp. NBRC 16548]
MVSAPGSADASLAARRMGTAPSPCSPDAAGRAGREPLARPHADLARAFDLSTGE